MNTELLKQKAEMLEEYFCINIDQDGNLMRLPVILDQHTPDMDRLPEFLLSLGNDVSSVSYFGLVINHLFIFFCFFIKHEAFKENLRKNLVVTAVIIRTFIKCFFSLCFIFLKNDISDPKIVLVNILKPI